MIFEEDEVWNWNGETNKKPIDFILEDVIQESQVAREPQTAPRSLSFNEQNIPFPTTSLKSSSSQGQKGKEACKKFMMQ